MLYSAVTLLKMGRRKSKKWKQMLEEESQFSKTDMQRIGVFKESGYISIGDPYTAAKSKYLRYSLTEIVCLYTDGKFAVN